MQQQIFLICPFKERKDPVQIRNSFVAKAIQKNYL